MHALNGSKIETRQPLTTAAAPIPGVVPETSHQQTSTLSNPRVALYQKLLAVMRECGYIQKDRKNTFHNYSYASEAAIKERLHVALVNQGLLFFPSASVLSERTGLGKDGKDALTTLLVRFRFVDADTGEFESGEFIGTGVDPLDKGAYKALTGAIKYILTSWFLIATGDDPEERPSTPEPPPPEPRRVMPMQPKPWQNFGQMKERFEQIREKVGEVMYSEELARSGVENPAQFKSGNAALQCYGRLLAIAQEVS